MAYRALEDRYYPTDICQEHMSGRTASGIANNTSLFTQGWLVGIG